MTVIFTVPWKFKPSSIRRRISMASWRAWSSVMRSGATMTRTSRPACTARGLGIEAQFRGDEGANRGDLHRVVERVLIVGKTEVQFAEQRNQLRMNAGEVQLRDGLFAEDRKILAHFAVGDADGFLDA